MREPMNNFTVPARHVLALAHKEAQRLGHRVVETPHLLLAVIKREPCDALKVLRLLGVEPENVGRDLEADYGDPESGGPPSLGYSADLKRSLAFAGKEAKALRHEHVGTQHLLLGMLREEGRAAQVLNSFGVEIGRVRGAVIAAMEMGDAGE
jgi:ATP-dependent Clp protease ATP-binding subunit ClpC